MSAWVEENELQTIADADKKFEDNFVSTQSSGSFQPLEDHQSYLSILESRLTKIKKDPSVLQQLKEKREECLNNLLNDSYSYNTDQDFVLEEELKSSDFLRNLIPEQPQSVGEIAHLVQYDTLDQQKQKDEEAEVEQEAT